MAGIPAGREARPVAGSARHYQRRRPDETLLYQIIEQHSFVFSALMAEQGPELPGYVRREFEDFLKCGRLEHGFLRVRCERCRDEKRVAFSGKRESAALPNEAKPSRQQPRPRGGVLYSGHRKESRVSHAASRMTEKGMTRPPDCANPSIFATKRKRDTSLRFIVYLSPLKLSGNGNKRERISKFRRLDYWFDFARYRLGAVPYSDLGCERKRTSQLCRDFRA